MSRKDQSPAAYNDVKYVMDMALERPGLIYELKTPGKAVNFKLRCNKYRNLRRDMAAEAVTLPGFRPETAYDILVIRQTDEEGNSSRKGRRLVFDHAENDGVLLDPETGAKIDLNIPHLLDR